MVTLIYSDSSTARDQFWHIFLLYYGEEDLPLAEFDPWNWTMSLGIRYSNTLNT